MRDWHTHNSMCHHAIGSLEDYVKKGIELDLDLIGISDHFPYDYLIGIDGIPIEDYGMNLNEIESYISTIEKLKEKYKSYDIVINHYGVNQLPRVMEYYCDRHDFDFDEYTYDLKYKEDEIKEFFRYVSDEGIKRIWIVSYWPHVLDPDDKTEDKLVDEYNLIKVKDYEFRRDITLTLYEVPIK